LDAPSVINELKVLAAAKASTCSLLRIYWYDGAVAGMRLTADQALLASLDDVKVRLGFINSAGQQKGVDSLIVTDLIELARQKAVCDAIFLSGDEDVRVGVQIAQNYGVRIHLLGIAPTRGSQSLPLMHEADTTHEWNADTIRKFLSVREQITSPGPNPTTLRPAAKNSATMATAPNAEALELAAKSFVQSLQESDLIGIQAYWESGERGIPPELDRRLLPSGRDAVGRDLNQPEKRLIRSCVQRLVKERIGSAGPDFAGAGH
jgi:uncharacterized LabA/DUF88 family protein